MTVKVRQYRNQQGRWEVDIMLTFPGRPPVRERRKAPVGTKSAAKRWGEDRERQLIAHYSSLDPDDDGDRPGVSKKEVPTLAAFVPRYIEGHCKANRLRPSTICQREGLARNHLVPVMGRKRLHRINAEDIQRLKAERAELSNVTINLMLAMLSSMLNCAVEWGVIDKLPLKIKKLKEAPPPFKFYGFDDFDRLVLAAERLDKPKLLLTVLLGGEAGLRCSEIRALRWSDIDLKHGRLTVSRALWRNEEGPPKGGRSRTIPLAPRLHEALKEHRHLRSPLVLPTPRATPPAATTVRRWLLDVQDAAGIEHCGPHVLRHTFCSHLAMLGKPAKAIQELVGHASITTTERYMHLGPDVAREATEGLRRPPNWRSVGEARPSILQLQ